MKKILFISKTVLSIALIVTVVSVAHAWTAPTTNPTGGNVPAPVNTGSVEQTKDSGLGLVGNLMAFRGFFSQYVNAPQARFGCLLFSCGSTSFTSSNIFEAGLYDNGVAFSKGLIIGADGKSTISGNLQITSGNPGTGKVLTSDATGNAVWGNAVPTGAPDIMELHTPITARSDQNQQDATAFCPPTHPIAISGGGGCKRGYLIKTNVNYLGHDGSSGQVTVQCRMVNDGNSATSGWVNGVDLVCAKTVPGGIYGGVATALPTPPVVDNRTWHYAGTPSSPSASSCGAAYGVSNQDVAALTIPATSPNYSYTLPNDPNSLPANQGMTIQQAQCSTTGSTNYVSGAATLPAGATWANQSTGPAFSTGNGTFGKFFYYTLKRY